MLIEGHPLSGAVELMPLKLNGPRLKHEGNFDKQKKPLLPEVTGQNILNSSNVPAQFNYVPDPLILQSPKPANIFMNKAQPIVHSTHFVYDYLFVQVTEAQYLREY
jgi:hypothetical protein